jgi:hypothetical protein
MLEAMYRAFLDLRADALEALREGRLPIRFPAHGIPPPLAPVTATPRRRALIVSASVKAYPGRRASGQPSP